MQRLGEIETEFTRFRLTMVKAKGLLHRPLEAVSGAARRVAAELEEPETT